MIQVVDAQPFPLVFVTISGAHLYGFPSPDSDYDLRGVHVLPVREVVGMITGRETIESSGVRDGLEIDLVTHDARKFFGLMLKKNGYVLEQLCSPLVVRSSAEHQELKSIGTKCVTKFHAYHYLGFSETQWGLFGKEQPPRVQPLLYVYRVLLTGIHLMRSGVVEANLPKLLELVDDAQLSFVPGLIARKLAGPEQSQLAEVEVEFHARHYERLREQLRLASERSALPEAATAGPALHDLLLRLRGVS